MKALAVIGPTASGKTAFGITLARAFSGEIISCDSMQIYREMDIGTAKPSPEERAAVPHHLIDFADPRVPYSAADYAADAMRAVRDITKRGRLPIFVGGTGLYLDAVRTSRHEGAAPPPDPALRERLQKEAGSNEGKEKLYLRLMQIDPDAARATHPNNTRRVIRALEIYESTGRTKTALDAEAAGKNPDLDLFIIGIGFHDRDTLNARIDARVDAMLRAGLADETERLLSSGLFRENRTAAAAIGYKELLPYLTGETDLAEATARLKTATRRYAKRQMTYFRAMPGVRWLFADEGGFVASPEDLLPLVRDEITAFLQY